MTGLQLTFAPDDEWHGELFAAVAYGGFAGRGSAWFNTSDLRAFCERLGDYPLDADMLPALQGGYWGDEDRLEEVHLSIRIAPHNASGALAVSVAVAEESHQVEPNQRMEAKVCFVVGYNELDRFRLAFERVLQGEADLAVLSAVPPG